MNKEKHDAKRETQKQMEEVRANMRPLDVISGFHVRPGFYEMNGASAMPEGVNFTLISRSAASCTLLLFHRQAQAPYARIVIPENYRVGNVWSIFVSG